MLARAVKVVGQRLWESAVTKTLFCRQSSMAKILSSDSLNPRGSSGTTKTRERSISGAANISRDVPSFGVNTLLIWGVERMLRATVMTSGFSVCKVHDGTENETMRGDVPAQEDESGSKTTSGRASVPDAVIFPKPNFKEAKILYVFRPCRLPCKTSVPVCSGSISDRVWSSSRGTTRMTETVGGTRINPRNLPSFFTGARMNLGVYTPARWRQVQRSW